jgi:hypothetical protein
MAQSITAAELGFWLAFNKFMSYEIIGTAGSTVE